MNKDLSPLINVLLLLGVGHNFSSLQYDGLYLTARD